MFNFGSVCPRYRGIYHNDTLFHTVYPRLRGGLWWMVLTDNIATIIRPNLAAFNFSRIDTDLYSGLLMSGLPAENNESARSSGHKNVIADPDNF